MTAMASGAKGSLIIELFGPFRKFGRQRDLEVDGPLGYGALLDRLGAELGEEFTEQARRKNTTVIVNNRIASPRSLDTLEIVPGDRVAFALLLGGG